MGKQLVHGLQDELHEAPLRRPVGRLLGKLSCLGVEIDVAPEAASKLVDVNVPVGRVVQGGK